MPMTDNVISHPHSQLMAEAQHEREVVDSPEAQALMLAAVKAAAAYSDFLEQRGVIWDHRPGEWPRMKASALVIAIDYGEAGNARVELKDGPIDRVYGNGTNPDPFGLGPPDIPHRQRDNH